MVGVKKGVWSLDKYSIHIQNMIRGNAHDVEKTHRKQYLPCCCFLVARSASPRLVLFQ